MHVCVYGNYQNPKIDKKYILIYVYVCVYAWYSNTLKSYAARRMTYPQTRIWIPSYDKGIRMHVCVCVCVYVNYQNPKINGEGILMYGCVCVYAWYSDTLKSYAKRRMTYLQTRIWIPSLMQFMKWAAAWQNKQNDLWAQQRLRVFGVRMKKHWALNYLLSAQWRLWSDWADDLSLRWAHMSFHWFCRGAAQIFELTSIWERLYGATVLG